MRLFVLGSLHEGQISRSPLGALVITSVPLARTATSSSMRIPPTPSQVDSRLQSHDVTYAKFLCLCSANPGRFMHFNTQAVAGTMNEITPQPIAIERSPRRPVH